MTPEGLGALVGVITGLTGAIVAIWRARVDHRQGISSDERQAREQQAVSQRDTVADRDGLIDQFQEALTACREREAALEAEVRLKTHWARTLEEYAYALEDHYRLQKEGPPPERPIYPGT